MSANLRLLLTLAFIAVGPIAWLLSDIYARPLIRRICGVLALCSALMVGFLIGVIQDMRLNTAYSTQTHELLVTATDSLRVGKNAQVILALDNASNKLGPTYENSHYLEITKEAIEQIKK